MSNIKATLDDYCYQYNNVIPNDKRSVTGLPFRLPDPSTFNNYLKTINVTSQFMYRPDKLALWLWNDETLGFLLNHINGFNDIKDYFNNRIIYYVDTNDLKRI